MNRKASLIRLSLSFLILAAVIGLAQDVQLDVPYVPTRYPVVDEMLRLANVTKDDVLYDLGCGDGRIVIGAAQKYGCRGVGIDIDPERIKECLENAKKAGVIDKVKFIQGDLFEANFREATVLPMYLLTSVNLKLRPKILRELLPGSRVVSHNFGMDNWKPDAQTVVHVEDTPHDVFLWIVPANISGTWKWAGLLGAKAVDFTMDIVQAYQHPQATVKVNGNRAEVADMKLVGDKVTFLLNLDLEGRTISLSFEGKAFQHQISGTIRDRSGAQETAYAWKAARNPVTVMDIDDKPSWIY